MKDYLVKVLASATLVGEAIISANSPEEAAAKARDDDKLDFELEFVDRGRQAPNSLEVINVYDADDDDQERDLFPGAFVPVADLPAGHFRVFRLVDAYVRYETTVEADSAQEAWDTAHDERPGKFNWTKVGTDEYYHSELGVEGPDGYNLIEPQEE